MDERGPLTVLASGMIGSRNGCIEAPYVDCPADTVARTLHDGSRILFLPGLRDPSARPYPDVMRGGEVQIVGFGLDNDGIVVLAGTRSKWAKVEGGRITSFRTLVTGELYALLSVLSGARTGVLAGKLADTEVLDYA